MESRGVDSFLNPGAGSGVRGITDLANSGGGAGGSGSLLHSSYTSVGKVGSF